MNEEIVISVKNLNKVYKLYDTPKSRLKEALNFKGKKYHKKHFALKDVSFEVKKGESLGILGKNGAGKSTLLKILTNVLTPTSGEVVVNGKVAALLELGAGFNPSLSGLENIFFQGAIMGYTREEMQQKLDEILKFADIGDFIRQPVRTYSSGMFARLAFSIAINVEPDILIVDEALSVGDAFFQAKCMIKMKELLDKEDLTLLFVTHSISTVKNLCRSGMLISSGEILKTGSAAEVAEKFLGMNIQTQTGQEEDLDNEEHLPASREGIHSFLADNSAFAKRASWGRVNNNKASFKNVQLLSTEGQAMHSVEYGQVVKLKAAVQVEGEVKKLAYAFHIRTKDGVDVFYSSSGVEDDYIEGLKCGDIAVIEKQFKLQLLQGNYSITAVLSLPDEEGGGAVQFCDYIPIALTFDMEQKRPIPLYGLVHLENTSTINYLSREDVI